MSRLIVGKAENLPSRIPACGHVHDETMVGQTTEAKSGAKLRHDRAGRRPRKKAKAVREPRPTKLKALTNHFSPLTLQLLP